MMVHAVDVGFGQETAVRVDHAIAAVSGLAGPVIVASLALAAETVVFHHGDRRESEAIVDAGEVHVGWLEARPLPKRWCAVGGEEIAEILPAVRMATHEGLLVQHLNRNLLEIARPLPAGDEDRGGTVRFQRAVVATERSVNQNGSAGVR